MEKHSTHCRVYAPSGAIRDLLRLSRNGRFAGKRRITRGFVNQIVMKTLAPKSSPLTGRSTILPKAAFTSDRPRNFMPLRV